MTLDEKIKMLNDYAIAWYSSSQADYIHEAAFRAQGFGKFADLCKEEAEEELEEARKCTQRVVALGGKPVFGVSEQPIFCEIRDLLKDWDDGFKQYRGVEELEKIAASLTDDSITRKNPLLHSVEILAMISASYGGGADGDAERYNRT